MAADVDTGFIASAYSFPESSLHTLLTAPTLDLVKAFFKQTETKAQERQTLEAEKLRTEVELETAVRSGEARARQLKDSVEKGLKEIESLRVKLSREGTVLSQIFPPLNHIADRHSRNRKDNRRIGTTKPQILYLPLHCRSSNPSNPH